LIWGRNDTPFKSIGRSIEYFPERIGDARNATTLTGWDRRENNMMMYTTPVLGEMLKVAAQFVPDQGVEDGSLFSASAVYDKNAFMVGVGFENHGKGLDGAYDPANPDSSESSTGIRAWSTRAVQRSICSDGHQPGQRKRRRAIIGSADYLLTRTGT
jgi:hypothetical protein